MHLQKIIIADEAFGLIPCENKGGGAICAVQIKINPKADESSRTFRKGRVCPWFGDQNWAQAVLPNRYYAQTIGKNVSKSEIPPRYHALFLVARTSSHITDSTNFTKKSKYQLILNSG